MLTAELLLFLLMLVTIRAYSSSALARVSFVFSTSSVITSINKLDFKNFKWSWHDYGSAKRSLGGIQEDNKVAKKMVMCFHFVEGWRF